LALARGAIQGSLVRILNSEGTLIIALAIFTMIIHRIHKIDVVGPIVDKVLLSVFTLIVVLSAQRSVWLGSGFGLSLMVWFYHRRSVVVKIVMVVIGMVLLLGAVLSFLPDAGTKLAQHFDGILNPSADATASWRIEGWQRQLSTLHGASLMFGQGLGGYYSWKLSDLHLVTAQPHNAYVQMVLKFGLLGLIVYALLAYEFFRSGLAVRKRLAPGPVKAWLEIGLLNFAAGHAYMLGYGIDPIILMYFALGNVTIRWALNSARASRVVPINSQSEVAFKTRPQLVPGR